MENRQISPNVKQFFGGITFLYFGNHTSRLITIIFSCDEDVSAYKMQSGKGAKLSASFCLKNQHMVMKNGGEFSSWWEKENRSL
jgi:hypothetical protein